MQLTVTKENILKGKPKDANCCAIALALKDAGWTYVSVGPNIIYCTKEPAIGKHFRHSLDSRWFMQQFDNGHTLYETKLELED